MKKLTKAQLHKNFLLIHDFIHGAKAMKEWVRKDKTYIGVYHEDWNEVMETIKQIGEKTGYELVIGWGYSYWNKDGENLLDVEYGGYGDITSIYEAIVEFIKNYK